MRKWFVCLLMLLAWCAPAHAQTWQEIYQTKWRNIEVAVEVAIPDVEGLPVLKVCASHHQPNVPQGWTASEKKATEATVRLEREGPQYQAEQARKTVGTVTTNSFYPPYDMDRAYAVGSDVTLAQALEVFCQSMEAIGEDPDDWDWQQPTDFFSNQKVNQQGEHQMIGGYSMQLNQKLLGAPLYHQPYGGEEDGSFAPRMLFQLRLDRISINYQKVDVLEVMEDTACMPWEEIQAIIEQEIQAGHIRHIYSVSLGYALFSDPDTKELKYDDANRVYFAKPVWQVECLWVNSPSAERKDESAIYASERHGPYFRMFQIDAQTGQMIAGKSWV